MSNQTFKEQAALFVGQAASLVSEGADKVVGFVKEQKDNLSDFAKEQKNKAQDYLNDAKTLYQTKKALDDETSKLERLYAELGKTLYHLNSNEGRTPTIIGSEIQVTLVNVKELQAKYDALKEAYQPGDDGYDDGDKANTNDDVNDDEAFVRHFYSKD